MSEILQFVRKLSALCKSNSVSMISCIDCLFECLNPANGLGDFVYSYYKLFNKDISFTVLIDDLFSYQ